ncbi:hypothetical protein HK104_001100 [Borealophlyctis nickersoniae]|nr:hypothetical protein HK104_001100 [Borealophlyctis nickersoniae]
MVRNPNSSTADDPNLSVNSQGNRVVTSRVWSWSRVVKGIKQGRVPISVLLITFIVPLSAGVAVLSWALTYQAALASASTLANALQEQILARIVSEFTFRIKTLERSADQHSRNWHDGHFSKATDDDKAKVVDILINTLVPNVDWYTSQHFTLVPEGEMWGVDGWLGENGTYVYSLMYQYGRNWVFYLSDEDGNNLIPDGSEDHDNSDINQTDPKSAAWTKAFVFEGYSGYLTHTHAIFQGGKFIGVQGSDFTLDFVHDLLAKLASAIPYNGYLYAIELGETSDVMLGASLNSTLYDIYERDSDAIATRAFTLPEFAANSSSWESLKILHDHLLENNPNGSLLQYFAQQDRPKILEFHLSDGIYLVQMTEVISLNLHWGIIHFVRRDDILDELTKSNRKIIGIVAGVVTAGVVASAVFSYFLARALHKITRDLVLLSDFQFKDVLQKDLGKGSGMARPNFSRIAELWQIQRAFHKMVIAFAEAVSQKKFLDRATPTNLGKPINTIVGTATSTTTRESV